MIPNLPHLQFAVLECIGTNRVKGHDLRTLLTHKKLFKSAPAFYQLMARMEDAGLVSGETEHRTEDGVAIQERFYRVTGHGERAIRESLEFYQRPELGGFGGLRGATA